MTTTTIEWTQLTWNPVTGCDKVSPGCDHCYAQAFAERWRGVAGHPYEQGFDVTLRPERLAQPFAWKRPSYVFVNSMSDLFHVAVPETFIHEVFQTMAATPQHTFQVLTKRAERLERVGRRLKAAGLLRENIWLGVSVETPEYYSRIRHLQRVETPVRFLSCEPLLAPLPDLPLEGISWVIVGGESGPGARPLDVQWIRDILGQCRQAAVAPFVKQMGSRFAGGRRKGGDMTAWPADLRIREMPPSRSPSALSADAELVHSY